MGAPIGSSAVPKGHFGAKGNAGKGWRQKPYGKARDPHLINPSPPRENPERAPKPLPILKASGDNGRVSLSASPETEALL
eukprot:6130859-Heterocapsa_arctica.AAC.1